MPLPPDEQDSTHLAPTDRPDGTAGNRPADGNPTADFPAGAVTKDDARLTVATDMTTTVLTGAATLLGYELLQEVGRGGMGVVYRARDVALSRDVAVKLLRDEYPSTGSAANRFVAEAQITGQLQHPGIPAVHQIGTQPDGRPFLAMKLIKGQTLEDLLKARPDPCPPEAGGLSSPARSQFVAIFEQVCQAVGYAHAHKVIHRDLKPQNVMVGTFGEVQVMDWGLAKIMTGREDEPEVGDGRSTAIFSMRPEGTETRTGSVLGTPAFMSPEQAGGEVARIDQRSDVFSLGGVLCAILTGEPPYNGTDAQDVHLKAVRGQLAEAFACLDGCGAEPELIALCKCCLSVVPTDRPADAGEVAKRLAELRAAADERARLSELVTTAELARQAFGQRKPLDELTWVFFGLIVFLVGLLMLVVARDEGWIFTEARKLKQQQVSLEITFDMFRSVQSLLGDPSQPLEKQNEAFYLQRAARKQLEQLLRDDPHPEIVNQLRTSPVLGTFRSPNLRHDMWAATHKPTTDDEKQWQAFWAAVEAASKKQGK